MLAIAYLFVEQMLRSLKIKYKFPQSAILFTLSAFSISYNSFRGFGRLKLLICWIKPIMHLPATSDPDLRRTAHVANCNRITNANYWITVRNLKSPFFCASGKYPFILKFPFVCLPRLGCREATLLSLPGDFLILIFILIFLFLIKKIRFVLSHQIH